MSSRQHWRCDVPDAFGSLKRVIRELNGLVATDGQLIERYAIGGAWAVIWFSEPTLTEDLDVFCQFGSKGALISLAPIYEYLGGRGYGAPEGSEHQDAVEIEGVPVQFLSGGPLVKEAIERAIEVMVAGEQTRMFDLEYLIAIALDVGRIKDRLRIEQLLEVSTRPIDHERLEEILSRHAPTKVRAGEGTLLDRWRRYLEARDAGF